MENEPQKRGEGQETAKDHDDNRDATFYSNELDYQPFPVLQSEMCCRTPVGRQEELAPLNTGIGITTSGRATRRIARAWAGSR